MIIPTLGNGSLYVVKRFKYQMLTRMERRRAYLLTCGIFAFAMLNALIWILWR